jgi:tetratricopeptide (TPR) repeat protein
MLIKLFTASLIIVFFHASGCITNYHSVRDNRDKSYAEGVELFKQNKYDEACAKFERVVEIDPDYRDAKQYLKRSKKLIILKKKNIEQKSDINYDKGVALMKHGRYGDALILLLLVQEQNPDHIDVDDKIDECREKLAPEFDKLLKLADRQYQQKQYLSAYATCMKAKIYNPSNMKVGTLMGEIEAKLKENASKYQVKGKEFFNKKQYNSALSMYQLAQKTNPWDSETKKMIDNINVKINLEKYYQRAVTFYKNGEYYNAKLVFVQVNNVEPSYKATEHYLKEISTRINSRADFFYNNGIAFYQKDNYEAAINEFNKVLSINPNHSNAQDYRTRAQTKLNAKKSVSGNGSK